VSYLTGWCTGTYWTRCWQGLSHPYPWTSRGHRVPLSLWSFYPLMLCQSQTLQSAEYSVRQAYWIRSLAELEDESW